jgi:hypothetical protein
MDEVKWLAYQRRAKEASEIRDTVLELYPGKTLRMAVLLGTRDRILGDKEHNLLREFYSTELDRR